MKKLAYIFITCLLLTSCVDHIKKAMEPKKYPYKIRITDVHPVQSMRCGPFDDPELNEEYTDSCVSDSAAIYSAIIRLNASLITEYKLKGKVEPHLPCITIYGPDGMPVDTTAIKDWSRVLNILHDEDAIKEIEKNVVGYNTTLMFDSKRQTEKVIEITDKMFSF